MDPFLFRLQSSRHRATASLVALFLGITWSAHAADVPVDLSVTITNNRVEVVEGDAVTYVLTVRGDPGKVVNGATVADVFPETLNTVNLTHIALIGGATTTASTGLVTGNAFTETVNLSAGSSIAFTFTASVFGPTQNGRVADAKVTNIATISPPSGMVDVDPPDNTAHDTDVVRLKVTGGGGTFFRMNGSIDDPPRGRRSVFADLDDDSDLDLLLAGSNNTAQRVYENDGTGDFHYALGFSQYWTMEIRMADLNGDGIPDAFAANATSQGNRVYLGNGDGTFTDTNQVLAAALTRGVDLGDVDGDGDIDAMVGNLSEVNRLWLNDGNAVFTDSGQGFGGNGSTLGVDLGDLDGDGDLDAFFANENADTVFLNNGSGTFTDSGQSLGSSNSAYVELGDLDGDGDLDAFVGNRFVTDTVWINNGSGVFTQLAQSLDTGEAENVRLGDFDGDGDLDAVVANFGGVNTVWINNGSALFTSNGQLLDAGATTYAAMVGDVDGDGDLDVMLSGQDFVELWTNMPPVDVTISNVNGSAQVKEGGVVTYTVTVTGDSVNATPSATVTDSFSDHLSEVTLANIALNGGATTAAMTGLLGSNEFNESVTLPAGSSVVFTFTALADGIGTPHHTSDIFVRTEAAVAVSLSSGVGDIDETNNIAVDNDMMVQMASGTGMFSQKNVFPGTPPRGRRTLLADIDGDSDLDLFLPNSNNAAQFVYRNNGTGNFSSVYAFGAHWTMESRLADLNGDGFLDVFSANAVSQGNRVYLGNGDSTFNDTNQDLEASISRGCALADLDGDGDIDAMVANVDATNRLWLNDGSGIFTDSGQAFDVSDDTFGVDLGDLDGDGDLDAFFANSTANKVYFNDGLGTFTDSGQSLGSSNSLYVELGDLDGDGDLDAFVGNSGATDTVWLNNGSGVFTQLVQSLGTGDTEHLRLADFDGDGDLDAVVANVDGANTVWLNNGSAHFTSSGQVLNAGATTRAVMVGDVDADGDVDVVFAGHDIAQLWVNGTVTSSVTLAGNDLVITDTQGVVNNQYAFSRDGTNLIISDTSGSGENVLSIDEAVAGGSGDRSNSVSIPFSSWSGSIIVNGSGGDDTITFDSSFTTDSRRDITVNGGAGTDVVIWETDAQVGAVNFDADTIQMGGAINTGGESFTLAASGNITIGSHVQTSGGEITVRADNDGDGSGTLTVQPAAAGTWAAQSVDTGGIVGKDTSLTEVDGRPAMSYFDETNFDLKFAINANADGSGAWTITSVDTTGVVGQYTSLKVVDGRPAIAYYSQTGFDLKFAINANADGSGAWTITSVDTGGDVGKDASLAVVNGKPAISYFNETSDDLKFAINASADGSGAWTVGNVDTTGSVGQHTSLAVVNGRPAISYHNASTGDLKFAINANADGNGAWTIGNVETTGFVGEHTSLAAVGGLPAISYYSLTGGDLKFAINSSSDGSGVWTITSVDTAGFVGQDNSLMTVDGRPAISYYHGTNSDLKYAVNAKADGSGAWSVTDVDTGGSVGQYTSLVVVGGKPAISYHAIDNGDLKFAILSGSQPVGHLASGSGNQMIKAAEMAIGGSISGTGALSLQPSQTGAAIDIGFATGSGDLVLDDSELSHLADGFSSITLGDTTSGTVTLDTAIFTDPVTLAGGSIVDASGTDLTLSSGGTLDGHVRPGGLSTVGALNVGGALSIANGNGVTFEFSGAASAGTHYDTISATGAVNLSSGVTPTFTSLSFTPAINDSFTLISRTGGTGTFAGLAEGATLFNFLGSGLNARITYTGGTGDDVVVTVGGPEIAVSGNGVDITRGDATPSATDHTDFGSIAVADGTVAHTFLITNSGVSDLTLTGTPPNFVTLTGAGSSHFSITTQPASAQITAGGGTRSFTITFDPTAEGTHSATVSVASNDADENPFTFSIQGTGLSAFTIWAATNGVSDDPNDLGSNGLSNLLNFASGVSPLTTDRQSLQYSGTLAGGGTLIATGQPVTLYENGTNGLEYHAVFVRRKDHAAAGLSYTPQFSTNLTSWQNSSDVPVILADDGTHQIVCVPYPPLDEDENFRFFRISVTMTP